MAYIDVITLAEAKNYLRIDDTLSDDDAQITSLISAALGFVEQETNIFVYQRSAKEYVITDRCVRVYDYPINSVIKGIDDDDADVTLTYKTNYNKEKKHLYTNFYNIDSDAVTLVLDVGHVLPSSVPAELKEVAFEIIDLLYYEHETGKTIKDLSTLSKMVLNNHKRFLL